MLSTACKPLLSCCYGFISPFVPCITSGHIQHVHDMYRVFGGGVQRPGGEKRLYSVKMQRQRGKQIRDIDGCGEMEGGGNIEGCVGLSWTDPSLMKSPRGRDMGMAQSWQCRLQTDEHMHAVRRAAPSATINQKNEWFLYKTTKSTKDFGFYICLMDFFTNKYHSHITCILRLLCISFQSKTIYWLHFWNQYRYLFCCAVINFAENQTLIAWYKRTGWSRNQFLWIWKTSSWGGTQHSRCSLEGKLN